MPELKNLNILSTQNWLLLSSSSKSDGKLKETEDGIVHLTTLDYTTLHNTTPHGATLTYTKLVYTTLHYTTLHNKLHCTKLL